MGFVLYIYIYMSFYFSLVQNVKLNEKSTIFIYILFQFKMILFKIVHVYINAHTYSIYLENIDIHLHVYIIYIHIILYYI